METIISTVIAGILIAAATSWITVRLSLKQFRSQKWWEKKFEAYSEILDAFHESKQFTDAHLRSMYTSHDVSDEEDARLREMAKDSRRKILRAADVGSFLLCREATEILEKYENDTEDFGAKLSWFDYIDAKNTIDYRALEKLIPIARKDLKQ